MLTSITLQNFKGIGDAVTIPIRPLTVMFGKNSAGKSTVVQALHYAREVLLNNNPNADRTALGGSSIDLGGFRNLVHNRDLDLPVKIGFDLDISDFGMPSYGDFDQQMFKDNRSATGFLSEKEEGVIIAANQLENLYLGRSLEHAMYAAADAGDDSATSMRAEFTVEWSETLGRPIVTRYETELAGEPAARIITSIGGTDVIYELNWNHRFLEMEEDPLRAKRVDAKWTPDLIVTSRASLPRWGEGVSVNADNVPFGTDIGAQTASEMLVAPGEIAVDYLGRLRYVGPLRDVPPRNFEPSRTKDESRWATGGAAWDRLYENENDLISRVSDWLGSNRLKTGYTLEVENYREIPLDSDLMISLQNNSVVDDFADTAVEVKRYPIRKRLKVIEENTGLKMNPNDIGVGISQVVPVVTAALSSDRNVIAIEQPELHLHPAIQSELGDLLMRAAFVFPPEVGEPASGKNIVIVETHSEHLILRILRRIRERSELNDPLLNADMWMDIKPEYVSLIYVEPSARGTKFTELPITPDGDLARQVPGGFFAERAEELF